ncbi:2OG-Fe(II) oxygenase [Pseudomonas typographi]|uniref:2OG-Fe(II) oxygenase n=1 Tax=Pseudomonas typographi TaxID=2715964 RepID=A0ABR7Z1T8_9PSED|nr:2OG-Fe(II) oxygenase [Pseudomonas typographi]MBD1551649.1 2OG-Fe(II) oxygenase [Pseudomonas typographi]MBD1599333.1 2OG-Fe(II) oxygenase [Pseudomonas typographi]
MDSIIDLHRYPLDRQGSAAWNRLVAQAREALQRNGMFNLEGFIQEGDVRRAAAQIEPAMATDSHTHRRTHNIYFKTHIEGLPANHPALRTVETVSHTLCADQLQGNLVSEVYEYPPLLVFLAAAMEKPTLHVMADPLARVNVMSYREGETLNWHFDRSEFTTTLMLQAPDEGGEFQYRSNLRSEDDPNYPGVARLLEQCDPQVRTLKLRAGTLNVFRGKNTAHRVTPVRGHRERIVAVFSYYEKPGVLFSAEEQLGFYGRTA